MTVKVSKPAINVRSELADLRKPTGIAGEAMLAAETPQEQFQLIGAGRRNLLINGGFDVWQRDTSSTKSSNTYGNFTADRWSTYFAGTYSKQATKLPNGDYANYLRGVLGTTSSNRLNLNTFIENGNSLFSGKYVTCSLWIKGSVPDASANIKLKTVSGSDFSSHATVAATTIITDTEWKKHEVTLQCSDDTANVGARPHVVLEIDGTDATWPNGSTFEIAQVQLELGKVATPFEHARSYGEELAACQRYFHRIDRAATGPNTMVTGAVTPTSGIFYIQFPTSMRASPAVTKTGTSYSMYSTASGSQAAITNFSITFGPFGTLGGRFLTAKVGDAGNSAWIDLNNDNTFFSFDAEI